MLVNLPLYCPNCSKKYTRQTCYDKHRLLCCNNVTSSSTLLDTSGTTIETYKSSSRLLQTVEALVRSNSVLKTEIAELKRQAQTQKRKIPIVDILNKKFTPTQDYHEYLNMQICRSDLEIIFDQDLVKGIGEIIKNQLSNIEDNDKPLQAFDKKENKIYGYTKTKKWELISRDNFSKIISKIIKNIMTEFKRWQDEHKHKLYTEDFSPIYLKNVKKVMGGNTSHEKICQKINNSLYQDLKKHLTSIEYSIS